MSSRFPSRCQIGLDLRTLQSKCATRFGMNASETLSAAEKLYEARAISYPRSDSRVLSDHLRQDVRDTLKAISAVSQFLAASASAADPEYRSAVWVSEEPSDRMYEIESAIHPLPTADGGIFSDAMKNVFDVVARHYIDLFDPLRSAAPDIVEHRHFTLAPRPTKVVEVLGRTVSLVGPAFHVVDDFLVLSVNDDVSGDAWLKVPSREFEPFMREFPFTSIGDLAARNPDLLAWMVKAANELVLPEGRGLFVCADGTYTAFNGLRTYLWPAEYKRSAPTARPKIASV